MQQLTPAFVRQYAPCIARVSIGSHGISIKLADGSCRQFAPARNAVAAYETILDMVTWEQLRRGGFGSVAAERAQRIVLNTPAVQDARIARSER